MKVDYPRMLACGLLFVLGCGKSAAGPDAPGTTGDGAPGDIPGHTPGMPGLGAHGLSYYGVGESTASSIATPSLTTQAAGSTIIVGIGRGNSALFDAASAPTDNKGNGAYPQLGKMEPYAHPNEFSGTALYARTAAKGGSGFAISTTTGKTTDGNSDEVTLAAVEVIEGTQIQAYTWNEVVQPGAPVTSNSVTTTGPATLIAFWWGELTATVDQTVKTNNGFMVVDSILKPGSVLQGAVAVRNAPNAGTYNVTWDATPVQGAQLWLIAVQ
jgi:hypothetical protein